MSRGKGQGVMRGIEEHMRAPRWGAEDVKKSAMRMSFPGRGNSMCIGPAEENIYE